MATAILANSRPASNSCPAAQWLTTSEAGTLAGLSFMTIVRACNSGALEHHVLPSGHRRVLRSSLVEWAGIDDVPEPDQFEHSEGIICGYYRVSTNDQVKQGNLGRQKDRLEAFIKENYPGRKYVLLGECGSGVNCDRKSLGKVIDLALENRLSVLVIEFAERLSRGSYAILSRILEKCGVEIILTRMGEQENMGKSLLDEGIYDCLALMTSIGAKVNGSKATKMTQVIYPPGLAERVAALYGSGISNQKIITAIAAEGWKDLNHAGRTIGEHSVRKIIKGIRARTEENQRLVPQCITDFIAKRCVVKPLTRVWTKKLYEAFRAEYSAECEALTGRKFIETLKGVVPNAYVEKCGGGHRFFGLDLRS